MGKDRSASIDTSSWASITPGGSLPAATAAAPAAAPASPAATATASAAAPVAPSGYTAPQTGLPPLASRFGPPHNEDTSQQARFGIAPASYPQTPQPAYGPPPGYAPPPKANRTLIILISVVGGMVGLAILAAIAIPVFLRQQKPVPVTLTLPSTLEGGTQLTTPQAQQLISNFVSGVASTEAGLVTGFQGAIYQRSGSVGFIVGAGTLVHRLTSSQRDQFMKGVADGAAAQSAITMAKIPPGPLGGTTECGMLQTSGTPAVICISMDNSAVVITIDYTTDLLQGTTDAVQLRSDVEHK